MARGDRRDFVLIDGAGEVHGLTRRVDGVKAAQIRERMADVDVGSLPDVESARLRVRDQAPVKEAGPAFVGTVELLRQEEKREERGDTTLRPQLGNADREAATALHQLQRTMAGQINAVVVGITDGDRRSTRAAEIPPVPSPEAILSPAKPKEPAVVAPPERVVESRTFLNRMAGWFKGRERGREADLPDPMPPPQAAWEIPPLSEPREHRPSAYLFIRLFGMVVEAYQLALDRAMEAQRDRRSDVAITLSALGPPMGPGRGDLFEEARRRQAEKAADGLTKLKRDEERRWPDTGPHHER